LCNYKSNASQHICSVWPQFSLYTLSFFFGICSRPSLVYTYLNASRFWIYTLFLGLCFCSWTFSAYYFYSTCGTVPIWWNLNNIISKVVSLPVKFPSGECMILEFYVTLLDSCCSLVLGHFWLTRYNPLIDWISGSISFRPPSLLQSSASVPPVEILVNPPFSPVKNPL